MMNMTHQLWGRPDPVADDRPDTPEEGAAILSWEIEEALREALSKGVSIASVKLLCYASGISYEVVTGAPR